MQLPDICVVIKEQTDSAAARRAAVSLAAQLGFDETSAGKVALVATETSRNLLKHAGGGQIILRPIGDVEVNGVEILALDKGPGMENITRCFEDGYSTSGTAGNGLGAVARLSQSVDIYSQRGAGTALVSRLWKQNRTVRPSHASRFRVGGLCLAVPGESKSGDAWMSHEDSRGLRVVMADGLGHGPDANVAAVTAIRTASEQLQAPAPLLLERIHGALRPTRGAAVAVAQVDAAARVIRFAGVGNIGGAVVPASGAVRRLVSHPGTAGHQVHRLHEFTYPWDSNSLLVMHSDGLLSRWSLDAYPGLMRRDPSVIAGVLYRDYLRTKDDVSVVVVQEVQTEE
jgi:anti-sigma regulatory factor (Ser/Thr protein kinase)